MIITTQQVGGLGACSPRKIFKTRCSEIASEAIFGPKLANTLTKNIFAALVHTALDNLGHQPRSQDSLLTHNMSLSESRLQAKHSLILSLLARSLT